MQFVVERMAKRITGAGEAGHDSPHWKSHHISQLSVGETLQLASREQFARPSWQIAQHACDECGRVGGKQHRLGIRSRVSAAMQFFVEWIGPTFEAPAAPITTRVADDREEPRTRVSAGERPEMTKCAQRSLLDCVLGILLVTHQAASETIGRTEMRQDDIFEAFCLAVTCPIDALCHVAFREPRPQTFRLRAVR